GHHPQRGDQLVGHRAVERVHLFRPIERDGGDAARDVDEHPVVRGHQTRSTIIAMPWPTPMHIVARPKRDLVRCRAWTSVVRIFAPVPPSGWPRAMPPP